jgi:hypothetical protein
LRAKAHPAETNLSAGAEPALKALSHLTHELTKVGQSCIKRLGACRAAFREGRGVALHDIR